VEEWQHLEADDELKELQRENKVEIKLLLPNPVNHMENPHQ
jgi:hypothetical protein